MEYDKVSSFYICKYFSSFDTFVLEIKQGRCHVKISSLSNLNIFRNFFVFTFAA